MMGTTAKGYPYPEGTDPVIDGDDAIHALAEAIDTRQPYGFAGGKVSSGNIAAQDVKNITVTLPAGRFTVAPLVVATPYTASAKIFSAVVASATASSFALLIYNDSGTTRTSDATWHALQFNAPASLLAEDITDDGSHTANVTCPTTGCDNQGVAITISPTWTEEDGIAQPVDEVVCGVCGTDITSSLEEGS